MDTDNELKQPTRGIWNVELVKIAEGPMEKQRGISSIQINNYTLNTFCETKINCFRLSICICHVGLIIHVNTLMHLIYLVYDLADIVVNLSIHRIIVTSVAG